jgi:hypothetical protein
LGDLVNELDLTRLLLDWRRHARHIYLQLLHRR